MESCVESAGPAKRGDGMVDDLRGVPKPMLQTVFGRMLGRRIWEQARRHGIASQPARRGADLTPGSANAVDDAEIVSGMIEYVSRRAAETLGRNGRQAKAIGLRIVYVGGVSRLDRMRLARPTNEEQELSAAAMELFRKSEARGVAVEAVHLTATSIQAERVTEPAAGLDYAMARAVGARA
jgi:nucleotidyltransferase/DNA polymerase involved in DNA repair